MLIGQYLPMGGLRKAGSWSEELVAGLDAAGVDDGQGDFRFLTPF